MHYMKEAVFNPSVWLSAVSTAACQLIWLYLVIGLPSVFFGLEGSFMYKLLFLIVFFFLLLPIYLLICFVIFRINLIGNEELETKFINSIPKEKGRLIGNILG